MHDLFNILKVKVNFFVSLIHMGKKRSGERKKSCPDGNSGKNVFSGGVLLAKEYLNKIGEPIIDPTGWWASEKFDGYRAVWNGSSFQSRNGKQFNVPEWFSAMMPPGIVLDGEFWMGRGCFESCGIFRKKIPVSEEWINHRVLYKVFDVIIPGKTVQVFEERMKELKRVVKERCKCAKLVGVPNNVIKLGCPLEITEQVKIKSTKQLNDMFNNVIEMGGEGVMLRKPGSLYDGKRSSTLLKVKAAFDTECKITGYNQGTGKYKGMLGSFKCALITGKNAGTGFNVSGMNDDIRKKYKKDFPVGTVITVHFNDYTKAGVPRHPRFLRKRDDVGL